MNRKIKCPGCGAATTWSGNPHRPFCSERCRLVDLGSWADGEYRIPGPAQDPMENGNVISIMDKLQDIER